MAPRVFGLRRKLGRQVAGEFHLGEAVDWEIAAVDFRTEGLLMAPAFAIPRLFARNGLAYGDIDLWEMHEAFAAQVLFHIKALEDPESRAWQGGGRRGAWANFRASA